MKRFFPWVSWMALAAFGGSTALEAATPPPLRKNRWGIRAKVGFNVKSDFEDIGNVASPNLPAPPGAGAGVDREYDNGFVRVPATTAPPGTTYYWGYDNNSQYDAGGLGGQGSIAMSSVTSLNQESSKGKSDDPHLGLEVSYGRDFGYLGNAIWGIEGALGFTFIDINDQSPLRGTAGGLTDLYGAGGGVPPNGQYAGTFSGPGFMLDDVPTSRTITSGSSLSSGFRSLESTLITLRLGPYIHYPINHQWELSLSAGPALAFADSSFTFSETVATTSNSALRRSGDASDSGFCFGAFVDGRIHFIFDNPHWSAFAGLQFMHLGDTSLEANGKRANLRLGSSLWGEIGVGYTY